LEFAYIAAIVVYVFVCFFLILVVLLQQGKGADIAGAFGGGGSQTAFGARGATTLLHKLTTGAFIGFIVLALVLTMLEARPRSSVVPLQTTLLSFVRIDTFAPATGLASSRRVTRISVFCGESLTERPRFVVCTSVEVTVSL